MGELRDACSLALRRAWVRARSCVSRLWHTSSRSAVARTLALASVKRVVWLSFWPARKLVNLPPKSL